MLLFIHNVSSMKKQTLKEYLFHLGVDKDTHQRRWQLSRLSTVSSISKRKSRNGGGRHTSITLSYPNHEAATLKKEAERYQMKLPEYLRQCIDAYRSQTFILPNEEQVRSLEIELKRIGNNINQIAKHLNQQQSNPHSSIELVRKELEAFDQKFSRIFRTPWKLKSFIEKRIEEDPTVLLMLLQLVTQNIKQQLHDHQKHSVIKATAFSICWAIWSMAWLTQKTI